MASKNGVFVNGCPITERALIDGDQVRIGDSALVVLMLANSAPVEPVDSAVTMSKPADHVDDDFDGGRETTLFWRPLMPRHRGPRRIWRSCFA